jgi:CheY-like chemotaxis protein
MPHEDGLTLLRRIRADETRSGRAHRPAVAVTAYAGEQHREIALQAGFADQLAKPVLPGDLVRAIIGVGGTSNDVA